MSRTDAVPAPAPAPAPLALPERRLAGIPACAGVAIGPVFRTFEAPAVVTRNRIHAEDVAAELTRFEAAVAQSRKQLLKLRARLAVLPEESQGEIAPLLDAYLQMLGPSRLVRGVQARVRDRLVSAETAVMEEANAVAAALAGPADGPAPTRRNTDQAPAPSSSADTPAASGRSADTPAASSRSADTPAASSRSADEVREIGRRLVRNLTRAPFRSFADCAPGSILVAEGLRPSDAALIDPTRIAGVATEEGGTDGHTAILLRALGVPSVLGAPGLLSAVQPGTIMVVDGATGTLTVNPTSPTLTAARRAVYGFARERHRLGRLRHLPAVTLDGEAVALHANMELPVELPMIAQAGATGIGLLRTEFLFMNRDTVPTEDEQAATYRSAVHTMGGDPVTIRVLDWGGEKEIEALTAAGLVPEGVDANPALGLRGIRMLLRQPALLEAQLAAILRASAAGPVRVLLPMVTNLAEYRAVRIIYQGVAQRLRAAGTRVPDPLPPLGIMVETPAAALAADSLAAEVEFFAIGTNDLCMYTLAVDRAEAGVADLYDPLHPAVLRLIQMIVEAGQRYRIPVSVCGEMAANPQMTPLLLGLGSRCFSTNASSVPRVKQAVRGTTIDDCQRLTWQVMKQADPARTRALLAEFGR